ncbi:helix-turn-helix domain-containing protein [Streptomyces sp. NPDC007100]|uniref:helix-turn-helix transcriptional regulator n=1 Tax=Streptomyces sp. NPDC007100 TaxID=3155602 RepID=UPI0033CB7076
MSHDSSVAESVTTKLEQLLDAAEVAARLRVSRSTVYNLVAAGRLPAHRMGGGKIRPRGLRIPESAVLAYLDGSLITSGEAGWTS